MTTPDYQAPFHSEKFQALPYSIREDLEYTLTKRGGLWHGCALLENRKAAKAFDPCAHSVRVSITRHTAGVNMGKVTVAVEAVDLFETGRRVTAVYDDAVTALDSMADTIKRFA